MQLWRPFTSPDILYPNLFRGYIGSFNRKPVEAEHLRKTETMAMQDAIAMVLNRERPNAVPHTLHPCTVTECDCWGKRRPSKEN